MRPAATEAERNRDVAISIDVNDETFAELVDADERLFLLDFHASWCAPCKALAPTLDELARSYGDAMQLAKIDIDEAPGLAERFGVRSVPMLVLYRAGREIRRVDDRTRTRISVAIDEAL